MRYPAHSPKKLSDSDSSKLNKLWVIWLRLRECDNMVKHIALTAVCHTYTPTQEKGSECNPRAHLWNFI